MLNMFCGNNFLTKLIPHVVSDDGKQKISVRAKEQESQIWNQEFVAVSLNRLVHFTPLYCHFTVTLTMCKSQYLSDTLGTCHCATQ